MTGRGARFGLPLLLFLAVAAFYWGTFSFRGITDTRLNSLQTRALALHGDVDVSRYGLDKDRFFALQRGRALYSIYGVGVSIVALPIYGPLAAFNVPELTIERAIGTILVAGSVATMFVLLARLFATAIAAVGAITFGFGTTMWPIATMAFWQQTPVVLLETLGLLAFLSKGRRGPMFTGLALGMATFVRPSLAVLLLFVGLYYLKEDKRALRPFMIGAAVPLAGILIQNRWILGSLIYGGYSYLEVGFRGDLGSGLFGELLGWWRGLFVYSPFLVFGFVGWFMAMRRADELSRRLVFVGAGCVLLTLLYASFRTWWGGENQFGYRYLLDITPALVVLACYAVSRWQRHLTLAVPAAVVSILTMTFGSAPNRAGWDRHAFADSFVQSPIGQAWIAFLDRPWGGLLRFGGIAALLIVLWLAASRISWRTTTA